MTGETGEGRVQLEQTDGRTDGGTCGGGGGADARLPPLPLVGATPPRPVSLARNAPSAASAARDVRFCFGFGCVLVDRVCDPVTAPPASGRQPRPRHKVKVKGVISARPDRLGGGYRLKIAPLFSRHRR